MWGRGVGTDMYGGVGVYVVMGYGHRDGGSV